MKLALTQMNICWEAPDKNRITCRRLTELASRHQCDWIVFPEMTLTGFTMQPELIQPELFDTSVSSTGASAPILGHAFFQQLSDEFHIGIVYGSIAYAASGQTPTYYNCMEFLQNGVSTFDYYKIHPFTYGEETRHYTGGSQVKTTFDAKDKVCLSGFICYDLRFPEIFQIASKDASVIFLIANWPEARIAHWYALLQARAIENQCFLIGVNRTGDGNGLSYSPSSVAYDHYGNRLTPACGDELLFTEIDPALAAIYRTEFPVKADRKFIIENPSLL